MGLQRNLLYGPAFPTSPWPSSSVLGAKSRSPAPDCDCAVENSSPASQLLPRRTTAAGRTGSRGLHCRVQAEWVRLAKMRSLSRGAADPWIVNGGGTGLTLPQPLHWSRVRRFQDWGADGVCGGKGNRPFFLFFGGHAMTRDDTRNIAMRPGSARLKPKSEIRIPKFETNPNFPTR